jgi:hypothetical protein
VARNVTGIQNDTEAVKKFRAMLTNQSNYFNDEPFPKNESNEEAHKRCSTIEDAKKHCPKRWQAAEKWWASARMVSSIFVSTNLLVNHRKIGQIFQLTL